MSKYNNILVIKLGAFGDFILTLGAMKALRKHHSDANITLITTPLFTEMAEKTGYFDNVHTINRYKWSQLKDWYKLCKFFQTQKYDCVYDIQRNHRSKIFRHISPKITRNSWFDSLESEQASDGILPISDVRSFPIPDMSWMYSDISQFKLKKPFVLIVSGCAPKHHDKRWPAEHYGSLSQKLVENNYTPVILGTSSEKEVAEIITGICPKAINLCNQTSFFDIAALAHNADGAIGNDTGPMHLITAVGCPSISLFSGASDPKQSAPNGKNVSVLRSIPIENLAVEKVMETFLKQISISSTCS